MQGRSKLDNWGEGADIHIFVFTHHKNNRFQKKLIVLNTRIYEYQPAPPVIELATATVYKDQESQFPAQIFAAKQSQREVSTH